LTNELPKLAFSAICGSLVSHELLSSSWHAVQSRLEHVRALMSKRLHKTLRVGESVGIKPWRFGATAERDPSEAPATMEVARMRSARRAIGAFAFGLVGSTWCMLSFFCHRNGLG
jgi:hypothetical protein